MSCAERDLENNEKQLMGDRIVGQGDRGEGHKSGQVGNMSCGTMELQGSVNREGQWVEISHNQRLVTIR